MILKISGKYVIKPIKGKNNYWLSKINDLCSFVATEFSPTLPSADLV